MVALGIDLSTHISSNKVNLIRGSRTTSIVIKDVKYPEEETYLWDDREDKLKLCSVTLINLWTPG